MPFGVLRTVIDNRKQIAALEGSASFPVTVAPVGADIPEVGYARAWGHRALERPLDWYSRAPRRAYAANAPAEEQHEGQMVRPASGSGERVIRGTGSVFADLDFPGAVQREAKLRLAYTLNQLLDGLKLSQAEVAKVLGVSQPKVSALRNYRLAGFSLERLMNLLTALDQDVEIVIRRKPRSRKAARISVVAA